MIRETTSDDDRTCSGYSARVDGAMPVVVRWSLLQFLRLRRHVHLHPAQRAGHAGILQRLSGATLPKIKGQVT